MLITVLSKAKPLKMSEKFLWLSFSSISHSGFAPWFKLSQHCTVLFLNCFKLSLRDKNSTKKFFSVLCYFTIQLTVTIFCSQSLMDKISNRIMFRQLRCCKTDVWTDGRRRRSQPGWAGQRGRVCTGPLAPTPARCCRHWQTPGSGIVIIIVNL